MKRKKKLLNVFGVKITRDIENFILMFSLTPIFMHRNFLAVFLITAYLQLCAAAVS